MNSCPSRSATRGTNSWPGRSARESNDAPSTVTSGPTSCPPTASAICDASNLTLRNGTVGAHDGRCASMSGDRIHLVVVFGGQSAEHDVSCTTAAHVLRAADQSRYRITPIGISTEGEWSLATEAVAALEGRGRSLPSRLDPHGDRL